MTRTSTILYECFHAHCVFCTGVILRHFSVESGVTSADKQWLACGIGLSRKLTINRSKVLLSKKKVKFE